MCDDLMMDDGEKDEWWYGGMVEWMDGNMDFWGLVRVVIR